MPKKNNYSENFLPFNTKQLVSSYYVPSSILDARGKKKEMDKTLSLLSLGFS